MCRQQSACCAASFRSVDRGRTSACRAPPRSCSRMLARPRRPHRRLQAVPGADAAFCVLALVASTHGAVRVLEQAVRAAVGTGALGVWRAAACGRASRYFSGKPGLSLVYPGFTWVLGRHPPVGRAVLAPARCTPLSVRGLARGTCRGVPPPPSCSHVLREWGRLGAKGGVFEDDAHIMVYNSQRFQYCVPER